MKRKLLNSNSIVTRPNVCQYKIDEVMGCGATSCVYGATYKDSLGYAHKAILKECYPAVGDIIRDDNDQLIWENKESKEEYLLQYRNTYEKLLLAQDSKDANNYVVHAHDIFEANGTLYIVTDYFGGETYNRIENEEIIDTLIRVKALARAVLGYHKNGYLYLDLKPENFLVFSEDKDKVYLFDFDSAISMQELSDNRVVQYSYSKDWAAPELLQRKIKIFGPWTDVYSIGAILFEKLMGHKPGNMEQGLFAKYDFSNEKFLNVSSALQPVLTNIFKKSLSTNVKRRYQTMSELIEDIEKAISIAKEEEYIIGSNISCLKNFVGRNEEITLAVQCLKNHERVILHGFGGNGKTELAKMIAKQIADRYDARCFIRYSNSLKESLSQVEIKNCGSAENRLRDINRLALKQRVLLVIDNFDVETDELLDELLESNADVLITTRNDFSQCLKLENVSYISVDGLPPAQLLELFKSEYGKELSREEIVKLFELFELIDHSTLMVPIIAKQIYLGEVTIYDYVNTLLQQESLADNHDEEVRISKDGRVLKINRIGMLRIAFRVMELDEERIMVLRNLFVLHNHINLSKDTYREYTNSKSLNALNDLIFRNLVIYNAEEHTLSLHNNIYSLIEADYYPEETDIPGIVSYIYEQINRLKGCTKVTECRFISSVLLLLANIKTGDIHIFANNNIYDEFISKYVKKSTSLVCNVLFDVPEKCDVYLTPEYHLVEMLKSYPRRLILEGNPSLAELDAIYKNLQNSDFLNANDTEDLLLLYFKDIEKKLVKIKDFYFNIALLAISREEFVVAESAIELFEGLVIKDTEEDEELHNYLISKALAYIEPFHSEYMELREDVGSCISLKTVTVEEFSIAAKKDKLRLIYWLQNSMIKHILNIVNIPGDSWRLSCCSNALTELICLMEQRIGHFMCSSGVYEEDLEIIYNYNFLDADEYIKECQTYSKMPNQKKRKRWLESIENFLREKDNIASYHIYRKLLLYDLYELNGICVFCADLLDFFNSEKVIRNINLLPNDLKEKILIETPLEQTHRIAFEKKTNEINAEELLKLYKFLVKRGFCCFENNNLKLSAKNWISLCEMEELLDENIILEMTTPDKIKLPKNLSSRDLEEWIALASYFEKRKHTEFSTRIVKMLLDKYKNVELKGNKIIEQITYFLYPLAVKYQEKDLIEKWEVFVLDKRYKYHLTLLKEDIGCGFEKHIADKLVFAYLEEFGMWFYKKMHGKRAARPILQKEIIRFLNYRVSVLYDGLELFAGIVNNSLVKFNTPDVKCKNLNEWYTICCIIDDFFEYMIETDQTAISKELLCGLYLFQFVCLPSEEGATFVAEDLVSITETFDFSEEVLLFVCKQICCLMPQYTTIIKSEVLEFLELLDDYKKLYGEI